MFYLKGVIIIIVLTASLLIFFFVVFVHYRLIRKLPEPTLPVEYKTNVNKIKRNCKQLNPNCQTDLQQVKSTSQPPQTQPQENIITTFDNAVFDSEITPVEKNDTVVLNEINCI